MSIRIQNGDIFVSSNHKNVILSTDFAPLICFLSMCYPLNNYMWFFSDQHTDIKKKNPEQVPVFQPSKICKDWFSHCNWIKWKKLQVLIKTEHLKFILHSNYFAVCLYSNGKWNYVLYIVLNSWKMMFFFFENDYAFFYPCAFLSRFEYIIIDLCVSLTVRIINYSGL